MGHNPKDESEQVDNLYIVQFTKPTNERTRMAGVLVPAENKEEALKQAKHETKDWDVRDANGTIPINLKESSVHQADAYDVVYSTLVQESDVLYEAIGDVDGEDIDKFK